MEILCRRRKNNPGLRGRRRASARPRMAEGLASVCWQTTCRSTEGRGSLLARHGGAARRARASAATSRSASRRSSTRCRSARKPILFIDEIHSIVGAGATTGGTMDLATLMKPVLTSGELRVVGSTTFEEFKQIEKDRALARRLQKVALDEPCSTRRSGFSRACRSATKSITTSPTRRPRSKAPRSWPRVTCATTAARQRDRPDRRSGRDGPDGGRWR